MPHVFTFIPTVTVVTLAFLVAYFVFRSFYYAQLASWLNEELETVIKQKFRLGQGKKADPKELRLVITRIMNHKYELRGNKLTVASAKKAYANEIYELFGFEEIK